MNCKEVKPLLGAYLDGELDLVHTLELEEHVQNCSSCTRVLGGLAGLSRAVAAAPRYTASPQFRRRITDLPSGHSGTHWRWPHPVWAAVAAGLLFGAVLVWRLVPPVSAPPRLIEQELVEDHIRSLLANHLLDVPSSDRRAVEPWFRGKLDYAPVIEDISDEGFELAGGRLDYVDGHTVAALVYQRRQHVVNVFVWPATGQPDRPASANSLDGFNIVGWRGNGMNWWVVSDLPPIELEKLPLCPCFMPPVNPLHVDAGRRTRRNPS